MNTLILQPNSTAQWYTLVHEAEKHSTISLGEDLESYLVFLLMRFTSKSEMVHSVLALDFLKACESLGSLRSDLLQDVGDKCLLFSGLFPGRAVRRQVNISYFVNLGQNAYYSLSHLDKNEGTAKLHNSLSIKFVPLMDVLLAMRRNSESLQPLAAAELWQETYSNQALEALGKYSKGVVILGQKEKQIRH